MDKSIVVTVPHDLGADAAKNRVAKEIERLRTDYLDKIARSEVSWSGNKADMRVSALGQTLTAQFDVQNDSLRIEVRLLGILSGLLNKTQDRLIAQRQKFTSDRPVSAETLTMRSIPGCRPSWRKQGSGKAGFSLPRRPTLA